MPEETTDQGLVEYLRTNSDEIVGQVSQYSYLIADSLYFIVIGMLAVFLVHKLASKFLYPYFDNKRFLMVTFGTLYVLVLVVTVILVLRQVGFDVSNGGPVAILLVLFMAVLLYFIIPFLPKLPFMPGHMIETQGVLGTVDSISSFHTTIRRFDGTMAFLPNALVMASKILNYSYIPHRRIEMPLSIDNDCDFEAVEARLLSIAANEHRVLGDPAPAVYAVNATAAGVEIMLYCWVENADFLGTRSDLWLKLVELAREDSAVTLSLPQQEVFVKDERA